MAADPKDITERSNYHVAMVFYPWANQYPLEHQTGNDKSGDRVVYATGGGPISGITSIQYGRRKGIGGTMTVEFSGYIQAEANLTVGTWCVLHTSHRSPLVENAKSVKVLPHGLARFIGQVYEINASYFADGSGRLVRKVTMTIREWCHALHCPIRYHPVSSKQNLNKVGIGKALADSDSAKRSELISKIGSSFVNVFQQPALSLAWVGALQKDRGSLLETIGVTVEDVAMFSNVIARLPAIPDKLLEDLFPSKKLSSMSAWTEGFMDLLSGVQMWGKGEKNAFWDIAVTANDTAERPVSPASLDFFTQSQSLYQMIANQVLGGGGTEVFADMWYGPNNEPKPVLVVRDIPFTLRSSFDGKFPWTMYDDLPQIEIPLSRIMRLDLKQGIHNTANLIEMTVTEGSWSNVAEATALKFFGTVVLPESQKRFGAQQRPTLQIRDIFTPKKKNSLKGDIKPGSAEEVQANVDAIKSAAAMESESQFKWFGELSKRQVMWFGADYLFPSCTLMVKDADFPIACGVNIAFTSGEVKYVGHCESFSQVFTLEPESGRAVSQTSIQLSRLCVKSKNGNLDPMTYSMLVNFLRQKTPDTLELKSPTDLSKDAFEATGSVDLDAVKNDLKAQRQSQQDNLKAQSDLKGKATVEGPKSKAKTEKK
jgi:hypothetical protein